MMLSEGVSIESLLGSDCKEPIFMMNPLFLHFCLWFLSSDQEYFSFENRHQICERIVDFCWNKITAVELDLVRFPAFDISGSVRRNDILTLKLYKKILYKCTKSRAVVTKSFETLD